MKDAWSVPEMIYYPVLYPRTLEEARKLRVKIIDFCYDHSSTEQMKEFVGAMLIAHPQYASIIKHEVLKICPQYEDMIDKLLILI